MKSKIYLIGGGELRKGETRLIDQDIMSQAAKGSNFVFIGFAAKDSSDYSEAISSVYGIRYKIIVPTIAKGRNFTIEALKSADVIYLGGGDTEELMRVFVKWGLIKYIHVAVDRGACIVGMSAGALILSQWYIHEDENIFNLRKGLGLIHLGIMVHANQFNYDRVKLLWSTSGLSGVLNFVAIGDGAAKCISDSGTNKVGTGHIWTITD